MLCWARKCDTVIIETLTRIEMVTNPLSRRTIRSSTVVSSNKSYDAPADLVASGYCGVVPVFRLMIVFPTLLGV